MMSSMDNRVSIPLKRFRIGLSFIESGTVIHLNKKSFYSISLHRLILLR